MRALVRGYMVEERPLAPGDEREGIDGRFKLFSDQTTLVFVIHVRRTPGRWARAYSLCSACYDQDPRQDDEGSRFCSHVEAVRAFQAIDTSARPTS